MSGSTTPALRVPTPRDAEAWARFVAVERARAYAHVMPAAFGERILAEVPTAAAALATRLAAPGADYALAETSAGLVGVAQAGPAPADWEVELGHVPAPAATALHLLYVHPDHHGTGLADQLLAAVLDDGPTYLWLIDGNGRAQRFYERHGFRALPEQVPAGESWEGAPMRRMVRG